jgi:hypothetical protein
MEVQGETIPFIVPHRLKNIGLLDSKITAPDALSSLLQSYPDAYTESDTFRTLSVFPLSQLVRKRCGPSGNLHKAMVEIFAR